MALDTRNFTRYLNKHEIEKTVVDVATRLNADYAGKKVVLVAVLKGAILFMADLIRHLDHGHSGGFIFKFPQYLPKHPTLNLRSLHRMVRLYFAYVG